jgi:alkyl hydroperoxide reductase subunit AhpC
LGILNEQLGAPFRSIVIIDKEGIIRFKQSYTAAGDVDPQAILAEVEKLQ